jgi:hypothetical protein
MSMFIVILLFILTNGAYFSALSSQEITQAATVAIVRKQILQYSYLLKLL